MNQRNVTRRSVLKTSGAAGAISLLGVGPVFAQSATRGGTLKVVRDGVSSLDPAFASGPAVDRNYLNMFYNKLFYVGSDGTLVPELAIEWAFNDTGTAMTVRLRSDVTFHDGARFNADAVKYSLERIIDPSVNAPHAGDLVDLDSVAVIDEFTAEIRLKRPSGVLLSMLASEAGMMVSPAAESASLRRSPVGTGPFKFVEWIEGNRLTAERNPDYWQLGPDGVKLPYLDAVDMMITTDTTALILAARAGSAMLTSSIQVKDFGVVASDPNLVLTPNAQAIQHWFSMNVSKPPFDNKDLRDAVLYAIDRKAIAKVIAQDFGFLTPTMIVPTDWIYDGSLPLITHDAVKASEALARSGFAGEIEISLIQRDPDLQIAQLLQAQLLQAGIKVNLRASERQAWIDTVLNKQHQIGVLQIGQPRVDPNATFGAHFGRDSGFNWSAVEDESLFDLVDQGRVATDRAERKAIYVEIQRHVLDNSYYGFLFGRPVADIVNKKLMGLEREVDGNWRLERVWLDA